MRMPWNLPKDRVCASVMCVRVCAHVCVCSRVRLRAGLFLCKRRGMNVIVVWPLMWFWCLFMTFLSGLWCDWCLTMLLPSFAIVFWSLAISPARFLPPDRPLLSPLFLPSSSLPCWLLPVCLHGARRLDKTAAVGEWKKLFKQKTDTLWQSHRASVRLQSHYVMRSLRVSHNVCRVSWPHLPSTRVDWRVRAQLSCGWHTRVSSTVPANSRVGGTRHLVRRTLPYAMHLQAHVASRGILMSHHTSDR